MNSDTLRGYARKLDLNEHVCSRDTITLSDTPMIVNTETSTQAGKHVIKLRHGYYFDSLAGFDVMTNTFEPILLKYNNQYIFNKTRFQSEYSSSCGLYCLYYLHYRSTYAYENTINELGSRSIADNESFFY